MIEDATASDLDRLLELWVALVDHGRTYGLHLRSDANRLIARETLAAGISEDRVLVARSGDDGDGAVVGFCSLTVETGGFDRDATRGIVENLYVEPAARGAGLGSALLEAGEQRLVEQGASTIAVEAMAADADVREFYRERGFEPHRVAFEKEVETNR